MTDVFISYKKEDVARVQPIAKALADAGYEVWWDHRIPPGRTYRDVIGAALQEAKCVIVVWSQLSTNAQWVLDEADEGKKRGVLLPFLLDDVDIPYGFRQIEVARLVEWNGDLNHPEWKGALDAVAHFVGRSPGDAPKPFVSPPPPAARPPAPSSASSAPTSESKKASPIVPIIAIAALLAVAGGGYFAWSSGMFAGGETAQSGDINSEATEDASEAPANQAEDSPAAPATQTSSTEGGGAATQSSSATGPSAADIRFVHVAAPESAGFRQAPGGDWLELGAHGLPIFRYEQVRRDESMVELYDDTRNVRIRVAPNGVLTILQNGAWNHLYAPTSIERGAAPAPVSASTPAEHVVRVWMGGGGLFAHLGGPNWEEFDAGTGQARGVPWREVSRDADTITLQDASRSAGARFELSDGFIYLYFPEWGEWKRQWPIRDVDRER